MRRRSGGFHYQSIEQFIEAYEASLSNTPSHPSKYSNIDAFLLHNQNLDNAQTNSQQEYFFSQIDQMLAEEDDELSLGSRNQNIVCNNIGLICQQLPATYDYLLDSSHISNAFTAIYQECLSEGEEIAVEVINHVVNVRAKSKKQTGGLSPQKDIELIETAMTNEKQQKKEETLRQKYARERVRRREIQLIVYYNRVQTKKQRQDKGTYTQGPQPEEGYVQTKLWLIRQREGYSPLLQAYMNKCQQIFIANIKDERLEVRRLDQAEAFEGRNPESEDKVGQNMKGQSWQSVLARLSASKCGRC